MVEERVEDVAIAVTTHTGCIPGKDRVIEYVEEVNTNLEFVVFPRRKRQPDRFGQYFFFVRDAVIAERCFSMSSSESAIRSSA